MSASGLLTPLSPHIQHNNTVVLIQTLVFPPLGLDHAFLWLQSIKQDFDFRSCVKSVDILLTAALLLHLNEEYISHFAAAHKQL